MRTRARAGWYTCTCTPNARQRWRDRLLPPEVCDPDHSSPAHAVPARRSRARPARPGSAERGGTASGDRSRTLRLGRGPRGADRRGAPEDRRVRRDVHLLPVPLGHRPDHGQGRARGPLGVDRAQGLPARLRRDRQPLRRPRSASTSATAPSRPSSSACPSRRRSRCCRGTRKVARVWCICFRGREDLEDGGALPHLRLPRQPQADPGASSSRSTGLHLRAGTEPEMMWLKLNDDGTPSVEGLSKPYCYHIDQFSEFQPIIHKVIEYSNAMGLDMIQGDHEDAPGPARAELQLRSRREHGRQPLDLPAGLPPGRSRAGRVPVLHAEAVHGRVGERLPPQHLALARRRERVRAQGGRGPAHAVADRQATRSAASSSTSAR